jgi:hypothetical protein
MDRQLSNKNFSVLANLEPYQRSSIGYQVPPYIFLPRYTLRRRSFGLITFLEEQTAVLLNENTHRACFLSPFLSLFLKNYSATNLARKSFTSAARLSFFKTRLEISL